VADHSSQLIGILSAAGTAVVIVPLVLRLLPLALMQVDEGVSGSRQFHFLELAVWPSENHRGVLPLCGFGVFGGFCFGFGTKTAASIGPSDGGGNALAGFGQERESFEDFEVELNGGLDEFSRIEELECFKRNSDAEGNLMLGHADAGHAHYARALGGIGHS
jgi:hypothetical protein